MKVLKFGGTSVNDEFAISRVRKIVCSDQDKKVVVISAMAKVTNELVSLIELLKSKNFKQARQIFDGLLKRHLSVASVLEITDTEPLNNLFAELKHIIRGTELLGEVTKRSTDLILSTGERASSYIVFKALEQNGNSVVFADAREFMKTDASFNEANVNEDVTFEKTKNILTGLFKTYQIIITAGYIASNEEDITTTLGRGGSDYSAALIAAALNAEKLEIWTDVDGVLTADPKLIKTARIIPEISYQEASELAYFGAKVLHPKTIHPAVKTSVPVYVRNTFNPEQQCTLIIESDDRKNGVKAIAFRKGITVINIHSNRMLGAFGFLNKVFEVFNNHQTSVDLVTTSEVSISLTIDNSLHLEEIIGDLSLFSTIETFNNKAIICAVGNGIRGTSGIAARFFGVLGNINISMVSIGASEINISIIVAENDLEQAIALLHKEFIEKH